MTKARDRLSPRVTFWKELLLSAWDIEIVWSYERCFDAPEQTIARAYAQWEYMHGSFTFFLPVIVNMDAMKLELALVHECGHFLVNEMREFNMENKPLTDAVMKHEERVVSQLSHLFLRLYVERPEPPFVPTLEAELPNVRS